MRWTELSADPMDARVLALRRGVVAHARRPPVESRTAYLCEVVRGRRVLDIGVVDHTLDSDRAGSWLHGELAGAALTITGVDVVEQGVLELQRRGYDVRCLDVTRGELPAGRYDVVVAGELIEHLARPGALFDAAADLLAPGGRLVLSSPNPYAIWRCVQHVRGREVENVDHVLYVDPWGVAELAERAGLRLDAFRGVRTRMPGRKAAVLRGAARIGLLRTVPEALCESIVYEVVSDGGRADAAATPVGARASRSSDA